MNVAGFGTLDKVEMKGPDSSWVQVKNLWGAAWELGVTPSPPLR